MGEPELFGRGYQGGIEYGEHNVSALNLMRIAAALQVEVGQLFPTREQFAPLLAALPPD